MTAEEFNNAHAVEDSVVLIGAAITTAANLTDALAPRLPADFPLGAVRRSFVALRTAQVQAREALGL